jgi:predicted amino acid dehydrogenase
MQRNTRRFSRLMREKDARRAALAKRDATAAVIGAGDFIGSAIAKRIRDAGSTKSAKATGFLDR